MIVDQIKNSPFVKYEFLNLVINLTSGSEDYAQHKLFSVKDETLFNKGSRDFVDYRPNLELTAQTLQDLKCKKLSLDSLHYEQVKEITASLKTSSIKIAKNDQVVNLVLPQSYEEYIDNLPRKKRHELKRKKSRFYKQYPNTELKESKDIEIFDSFVALHKTAGGEKGSFMKDDVVSFFRSLLNLNGWKIYYLEIDNVIAACCFVFEDGSGSYLYNSSKNNSFNEVNPGIIIIDKIIEKLIVKKFNFFDFLKGTERYKFDLGGTATQLYDVEITL